jgi:hypothetical protein
MNIRAKPRIRRLRAGIWICALPHDRMNAGLGNTPAEAYAYWCRNAGRAA